MARYVALLRGINVGGKNLIRMPALKACFEGCGYGDVVTYIQSGNVIFEAAGSASSLCRNLEAVLAETFDYQATVVLRSLKQMRDTIARAPSGFGEAPAKYRYDVIFLKEPLKAAAAMKVVQLREGVDAAYAGPGALYFSRLVARASQSKLTKLVSDPIYKRVTIRNWNTTTKLLELLEP